MFDLVVAGGVVLDGTASNGFAANVGVIGDRVEVVTADALDGAVVVDATACAVAPGFIDMHGHSDISLVLNPSAESLVAQGITTQVLGNCGSSAFPLPGGSTLRKFDPDGISAEWESMADYRSRLPASLAVNPVLLVGLGTVRRACMGDTPNRPATDTERAAICTHVDACLEAGAAGVSLGLHFEPDLHADQAELLEVSQLVGRHDALLVVHLRDYGQHLLTAVMEALELARRGGCRLHVSLLHAFGRPAWGSVGEALALLDDARAEGAETSTDLLLWPTVGAWDGMRAIFPPEVWDWRSPDWSSLQRTLFDRDARAALASVIERRRRAPRQGFYAEYLVFSDWADVTIEDCDSSGPNVALRGLDLVSAAGVAGVSPVDLLLRLVAEEGQALMLLHRRLSEADVETVARWPHSYLGLDAIATSPSRVGEPWNTMQPHPRHFRSTGRLLGHFVRDRRLLTIGEAAHRLTGGPARALRLGGRGEIRPGSHADLVVFQADEIGASADWRSPTMHPSGIEAVIVNGRPTVIAASG